MTIRPLSLKARGFTLLEMSLAMLLLALLVGMVFSTAKASLALGNSIVKTQNEEMLNQAFLELLHHRFSALPSNAQLDLQVKDGGSHWIWDLTLQQVPLSFAWGGQTRIAKAVQLSTVKRRSGFLDIVLKYYENEILDDPSSPVRKDTDEKPFAEIVLLSDVAYFEWRALDANSMEWQDDWTEPRRIPLQLELTFQVGADNEEIRQIFWIPPKRAPSQQPQ